MAGSNLTAARLRMLLNYNPESGEFTWKIKTSYRVEVGQVAGYVHKTLGYVFIQVEGTMYLAHRLAWLYMTGDWPKLKIDHWDGNRSRNVFGNLRDATHAVNMQNIRPSEPRLNGGLLGTEKTRGSRWAARIMASGKRTTIGVFDTAEEAHAAYLMAKRQLHEGCTI